MSLAQPCPPLLVCSYHEACLRFRYTFVGSIKSNGHELVGLSRTAVICSSDMPHGVRMSDLVK